MLTGARRLAAPATGKVNRIVGGTQPTGDFGDCALADPYPRPGRQPCLQPRNGPTRQSCGRWLLRWSLPSDDLVLDLAVNTRRYDFALREIILPIVRPVGDDRLRTSGPDTWQPVE